jgi:nitroreductase
MIIMEAHALEKGFSLPEVRLGYGDERIKRLIGLMQHYLDSGYDRAEMGFRKAQSVLAEYLRFHEQSEYDLGKRKEEILPWVDMTCDIGGYITVQRNDYLGRAKGDFRECAESRCSVRNYTDTTVPEEVIRAAVEIARKTPSVCNRQAWHTYIIKDPVKKSEILDLQKGSKGFGSRADFLAIITMDYRSFVGGGERNEAYVDGGLYAMSLLYAFHYYGIGACPLNWMVHPKVDKQLRSLLGLSPSENVIVIISAGYIPETVRIAKSIRRGVDEQLTII